MSILFGLVLFAALGACGGLLLDSSVLLLILTTLLLSYGVCFAIDLYRSVEQLKRILGGRSERQPCDHSQGAALTTAGEVLHPLITGALYQLTALEDELLSTSLRRNYPSASTDDSTEALPDSVSLEDRLGRVALNCGSTAIGVVIGDGLAGMRVESYGVAKERFEKAVRRYLRDYYHKRDTHCFGLFDTLSGAAQQQQFGAFGFRFLLCFPIRTRVS